MYGYPILASIAKLSLLGLYTALYRRVPSKNLMSALLYTTEVCAAECEFARLLSFGINTADPL
jgi:hypothetical protein